MTHERLLLASALVHARHGGHLTAVDPSGRRLAIGRHPSADVHPCRWRSMLIGAVGGRGGSRLDGFELVDVGGSLVACGVGGFLDRSEPGWRWFAVRLPPCLVVDGLRTLELGTVPHSAVEAIVRPDPGLGVTVVGIGVEESVGPSGLDSVAEAAGASWVVAELSYSLAAVER